MKAARQLRLPLVASAHTDYERYAARYGVPWAIRAGWHYLRWFYGQAPRSSAPRASTSSTCTAAASCTRTLEPRRGPRVVPSAFRSQEYRARFGVGPGDLLVTYIGRIAREKNIELLLRAWERLAPVRGSAQLVLVGGGPLEEIRRREIAGVHVPGLLQGRDLSAAYASADLFTFLRRPRRSATLLEAMGSGCRPWWRRRAGSWSSPSTATTPGSLPDSVKAIEEGLAAADRRRAPRHLAPARSAARERDWNQVYERLLADYAEAVEGSG